MKKYIVATIQSYSPIPFGTVAYSDSEFRMLIDDADDRKPVIKSKKFEGTVNADNSVTQTYKDKNWKKAVKPLKPVKAKGVVK